MTTVQIYTKDYCPYCMRAKHLLAKKGVEFDEVDVTDDIGRQEEMILRSNRRTVPQIFIDGVHIGGSDDLAEAERDGVLDKLIAPQKSTA